MTRSREKFVVVRGGSGEWLRCRLVVVRGDTSAAFAVMPGAIGHMYSVQA